MLSYARIDWKIPCKKTIKVFENLDCFVLTFVLLKSGEKQLIEIKDKLGFPEVISYEFDFKTKI